MIDKLCYLRFIPQPRGSYGEDVWGRTFPVGQYTNKAATRFWFLQDEVRYSADSKVRDQKIAQQKAFANSLTWRLKRTGDTPRSFAARAKLPRSTMRRKACMTQGLSILIVDRTGLTGSLFGCQLEQHHIIKTLRMSW
ncbi:MAG: hypothetical protein ACU0B7_12520 [Paracoccaceae bacterium]|nr:hypothetical protein [Seohaeicola saemankumensis]